MKVLIMLLSLLVVIHSAKADSEIVIGWLETVSVVIGSEEHSIKAKIDSGADHSSLHANAIKLFRQQDQDWVQFSALGNRTFMLPVHRIAHIKTKNKGLQTRPVVKVIICINGQKRLIEVNLVDRSHFTRPLLIGRSALSGFLINSHKIDQLKQTLCLS